MDRLRTVTVLEHEVVPVIEDGEAPHGGAGTDAWFSATEAQALLRLNDQRAGFCQRLPGGIKLAQHCGIVRLSTCVVEVLPKAGMAQARAPGELARSRAALLSMLRSAPQVAITKMGPVPQQAVQAPLLDLFVAAFLQCAIDQARRGLLSRYVAHADDLPTLKGRFHVGAHLRRNLARPHLLHVEHDEFTADNVYNRAVRAALQACRPWITGAGTQRLWFETHARYASVSAVRMSAADVAGLARDRTTHRYAALLTWCEWLLAMAGPALGAGASDAPGLLFDMNRLFEAHVGSLEEAAAGPHFIVHRQGPVASLARQGDQEAFALIPDVTVWRVGAEGSPMGIARVLDAKWKRLDPRAAQWGVDPSDVYQLLAYALRYRCTQVELVYPLPCDASASPDQPPVFTVPAPGTGVQAIEVHVRAVPLWAAGS